MFTPRGVDYLFQQIILWFNSIYTKFLKFKDTATVTKDKIVDICLDDMDFDANCITFK